MTSTDISGVSTEVPESVSKAIEDFGLGELSLLEVRECITLALEEDPSLAEPIHEALDDELKSRHLTIADYGELVGVVGAVVSENIPTEFSEETPDESGVYRVVEEGTLVPTDLSEWPEFQAHVAASEVSSEQNEHTRPFGDQPVEAKARSVATGSVLRARFRLDEEVAHGAMGVVYRATDLMKLEAGADDPQLAVKLVSPEIAGDKKTLRAFQNEVANTQHLSHPNIIRVFELDLDGDQHFITMEWLEGQSLALLLDSSRGSALQPTQTYAIIEQLCDALIYAHEHNVVHADVKPGNVFLVDTGEVKLIDFGIAHRYGETTHSPAIVSDAVALTPAYASCERLEEQSPTAQDDLFSLACLIYRLLAGRRVFGPLTALEAEQQGAVPVRIGGMDDRRWIALSKALAFRRSERQASIKEFAEEFGRRSHVREAVADVIAPKVTDDTARLPALDPASVTVVDDLDLPANLEVDFQLDEDDADAPEPELSGIFEEAALRGETEDIVLSSEPEPVPQPFVLPLTENLQGAARPVKVAVKTKLARAPGVVRGLSSQQQRLAGGVLAAAVVVALAAVFFGSADEEAIPRVVKTPGLEQSPPAIEQTFAKAPVIEAPLDESPVVDQSVAEQPQPVVAEVAEEVVEQPEPVVAKVAEEVVEQPEPVVAEVVEEVVERPEPVVAEVAEEIVEQPEPAPVGIVAAVEAASADTATVNAGMIENPVAVDVVADEPAAEQPIIDQPIAEGSSEEGPIIEEPVAQELAAAAPPPPDSVALSELEFVEYAEPKFPRSGSSRRYDGWVDVNFQVRADGHPRFIEVVGSNLPGKFEAASIEAVQQWRFVPYVHEGTPIAVNSAVRLRFAN